MLELGFVNAIVSKVLAIGSLASVFLDNSGSQAQYGMGVQHLSDFSQWWRLITSQFVFSRTDGALFGMTAFYVCRQLERQMGSSKFCGFVVLVTTAASVLQLQLLYLFPSFFAANHAPASGPYALVFALMILYWRWVPRRKRVTKTKICGILVTEKLLTWLFVANCFLAGGLSTLIPSATSVVPLLLYFSELVPTNFIRTPGFLNSLMERILGPVIASRPTNKSVPNMGLREQQEQQERLQQHLQRNTDAALPPREHNNTSDASGGPNREAMLAPMPPGEKIQALMELGFSREASVAALRGADNNVEIAGERLFRGSGSN